MSTDQKLSTDMSFEMSIIITTFDRPNLLRALLNSIAKQGGKPAYLIHVIDSGIVPVGESNREYTYTRIGNAGISVARNAGVSVCTTPYFLLLEDDFLFTEETDLLRLYKRVVLHGDDICGGSVKWFGQTQNSTYIMSIEDRILHKLRVPIPAEYDSQYPVAIPVSMVPNFFIGKKRSVANSPWDGTFRTQEHEDFFLTAHSNRLRVTWVPSCSLQHRSVKSSQYKQMRNNLAPVMLKALKDKWSIDDIREVPLSFAEPM
jgi:glycosyltransferase involved in cell wall biosynthesis